MQKVRRSKKEIEDALLPLKPYDWVFTEEEKKDIENNLPGYDPEFVKSFISDLEIVCALAKDIRENPTRSEFRNDNQRLANKLTDTLNVLTAFRNTKVPLYLPRHIDSIQSDELFHCFDLSTRASSLAAQAIQPLNELIQLVGQCISTHTNLQSGRPSADATGLTYAIAQIFNQTFEEIPRQSGAFPNVVSIARVAIGLDPDPSRSIRSALHPQP